MSSRWLLVAAITAFALFVIALQAEESSGEPNRFAGPLSLVWPGLVVAWVVVAFARRAPPRSRPEVYAISRRARDELVAARALSTAGRRRSAVAMLGFAVAAARREGDLEALREALALAIRLTDDEHERAPAIGALLARANTELELLGAEPLTDLREARGSRSDSAD